MVDNSDGRKWARVAFIVTLVISVVANVTHAVLAESEISLWLRVPGAAVWPILSFLAIEIIVRIVWQRQVTHYLARVFVLGPAIPAIIVSYGHQRSLLVMMGESALVAAIGPLAIDGLMIGCTLALLFTRPALTSALASEITDEIAPEIAEAEVPLTAPLPPSAPSEAIELASAPVVPGAAGLSVALTALLGGASTADAATASGLAAPTVRRYAAVMRELRDNPHATIDARKRSVRPDAVNEIRAWARLESVR